MNSNRGGRKRVTSRRRVTIVPKKRLVLSTRKDVKNLKDRFSKEQIIADSLEKVVNLNYDNVFLNTLEGIRTESERRSLVDKTLNQIFDRIFEDKGGLSHDKVKVKNEFKVKALSLLSGIFDSSNKVTAKVLDDVKEKIMESSDKTIRQLQTDAYANLRQRTDKTDELIDAIAEGRRESREDARKLVALSEHNATIASALADEVSGFRGEHREAERQKYEEKRVKRAREEAKIERERELEALRKLKEIQESEERERELEERVHELRNDDIPSVRSLNERLKRLKQTEEENQREKERERYEQNRDAEQLLRDIQIFERENEERGERGRAQALTPEEFQRLSERLRPITEQPHRITNPEKMYEEDLSGSGLFGDIVSRIKNTFTNTRSFDTEKILNTYGNYLVKGAVAYRVPIDSLLKKLLAGLSFGQFQKNVKDNFDDVYHLYMVIELINPNNTKEKVFYLTEKTPNIIWSRRSALMNQVGKMGDQSPLMAFNSAFTLSEAINLAKSKLGADFVRYTATKYNCQNYIITIVDSMYQLIGMATPFNISNFIYQDPEILFKELPTTGKISNAITGLGHFFGRLTGKGIPTGFGPLSQTKSVLKARERLLNRSAIKQREINRDLGLENLNKVNHHRHRHRKTLAMRGGRILLRNEDGGFNY